MATKTQVKTNKKTIRTKKRFKRYNKKTIHKSWITKNVERTSSMSQSIVYSKYRVQMPTFVFDRDTNVLVKVIPHKHTKIYIPKRATGIDDNALYNLDKITKVKIPNTVRYIGRTAFYKCTSLKSIEIPDNCYNILYGAFAGCTKMKKVSLGSQLRNIDKLAFVWCPFESIELPKDLRTIGTGAFYNCAYLRQIEIPDSVYAIGNGTFAECRNLSIVSLPNNIDYDKINNKMFMNCQNLHLIHLPENNIKSIGYYAFMETGGKIGLTVTCYNSDGFIELPNTAVFRDNIDDVKSDVKILVRNAEQVANLKATSPAWKEMEDCIQTIENVEDDSTINGLSDIVIQNNDDSEDFDDQMWNNTFEMPNL